MDFTRQRNDDLMRAYSVQIAKSRHIYMPDILRKVADSPAMRFYVSEERAAVVICAMIAKRPLSRMRPNKREMFDEIYRRFILLQQQNPDRSVYSLVAEVVNQPAPKFYLTHRTVGVMIYRIKKGWYDKRYIRNR